MEIISQDFTCWQQIVAKLLLRTFGVDLSSSRVIVCARVLNCFAETPFAQQLHWSGGHNPKNSTYLITTQAEQIIEDLRHYDMMSTYIYNNIFIYIRIFVLIMTKTNPRSTIRTLRSRWVCASHFLCSSKTCPGLHPSGHWHRWCNCPQRRSLLLVQVKNKCIEAPLQRFIISLKVKPKASLDITWSFLLYGKKILHHQTFLAISHARKMNVFDNTRTTENVRLVKLDGFIQQTHSGPKTPTWHLSGNPECHRLIWDHS